MKSSSSPSARRTSRGSSLIRLLVFGFATGLALLGALRPGGEAADRKSVAVDGRKFFEDRSYVTYTVEKPEPLAAVLQRYGLPLKPEVVRKLNPKLPADPLPAGTQLTLYIQATR